jgi:glycosyltransferase involved in cell wall biosynthesis
MKIVHLQKHLPTSGNAAFRLHNAFLEVGIDSYMLSLSSDIKNDKRIKYRHNIFQLIPWLDGKILRYLTRKAKKQFGLFSFPFLGINISKHPLVEQADIIYLHWINGGFFNLTNLKQLAKLNKPIIFFMHDMWTITGGCHHSFECEKYLSGCQYCPIFSSTKKRDLSYREFNKKLKLYSKFDNLHFVSPSKWLYDCAKGSLLTKNKPVFYIPNTIDKNIFKPFDKKIARDILNIGHTSTILAFGAITVNSPYKGWTYLQNALQTLYDQNFRNISVLIFGSGFNQEISDAIPFKTRFMGYLKDDYSTVLVYNAADIFIAPSLAETFGYVILESLLCGTPVVTFNVGGIPDLIKHKSNGYLANYKDSNDMVDGIKYCLDNKLNVKVPPGFETKEVINKHFELLNQISEKRKA